MELFGRGAPVIGNDILDIGSRRAELRARRQRDGGLGLSDSVMLGRPGAFEVPHVPDVSQIRMLVKITSHFVFLLSSRALTHYVLPHSPLSTAATTLLLPAATPTPSSASSSPRELRLLPSSLRTGSLSVSTRVPPRAPTFPRVPSRK